MHTGVLVTTHQITGQQSGDQSPRNRCDLKAVFLKSTLPCQTNADKNFIGLDIGGQHLVGARAGALGCGKGRRQQDSRSMHDGGGMRIVIFKRMDQATIDQSGIGHGALPHAVQHIRRPLVLPHAQPLRIARIGNTLIKGRGCQTHPTGIKAMHHAMLFHIMGNGMCIKRFPLPDQNPRKRDRLIHISFRL